MKSSLIFLLLGLMPLAIACSDGGRDNGNTSKDGGNLGHDGGIALGPSDGGTPPGGVDGGSLTQPADLAAPIDGSGTVFVYLTRAVSGTVAYSSTSVGATFYELVPTGPSSSVCSSTTIGACQVWTCTTTGSTPTPTTHEAAAGVVTVSGPGQSVALPTDVDSHTTVSTAALYWTGGETLSVSSSGATVHAFTDTIVVPEQIVVSAPYLPATGAVAITRTQGLTLDWSGGVHGEAVFVLGESAGATSASAVCRYPSSQAHAVLPASVLMKFPAGTASFSASTGAAHQQTVGSWIVSSTAYFNAIYDTGRTVAGQLTLN